MNEILYSVYLVECEDGWEVKYDSNLVTDAYANDSETLAESYEDAKELAKAHGIDKITLIIMED